MSEDPALGVKKTVSEDSCPSGRKASSERSSFSLDGIELDSVASHLRELCLRIDTDGDGYISELELINAVQRDASVAACVLPGVRISMLMSDEAVFDEVDAVFEAMAAGKKRVKYSRFVEHFRSLTDCSRSTREKRVMFDLIDADGNGAVSKLELVGAVQRNPKVAHFVLPRVNCSKSMQDQEVFDAITGVFQAISGGKRRFSYADFNRHFSKLDAKMPRAPSTIDRKNVRVFVIGPGFGLKLNPRQGASIAEAGYQMQWYHDLPNPEHPTFNVMPYLDQLKAQLTEFQPDVVAAASKGVAYVTGLWKVGFWRGPTLLINAHPTCTKIPKEVSLVLAHGSNDEVYPTSRADLEKLMSTGGKNQSFLYYTANSGQLASGHLSRFGDRHNMESLLQYELLPRLIDATLCPQGPEVHVVRTWRERLSEDRLEAESWLGYGPEHVRRHWTSHHGKGLDDKKLFDVPRTSEEFQRVAAVFQAAPKEPPAYMLSPQSTWDRVQIKRLQRIENGMQVDGSTGPYNASMRTSLEDQDVDFEPGVHTCWAFHGTDNDALESIVNDPVAGFQPLVSGSKGATLWGLGTYFAREAKYVADGGFCGQPNADGTRRMLMCLLSTGIPCLGDPQHKGVLPFRQRPHRYHSSVDCLSSPEVYIVQHAGAAHAAYLITFA